MIICVIMTSSESKKINFFLILACGQRGQNNKCGVISHTLWALFFRVQVVSVAIHREKLRMGGAWKRTEPPNYVQLKKKQKLQGLLKKGSLTPYIERLQGPNKDVTNYFSNHWKDRSITLHGQKVLIDESLISQVTGLSTKGMKFYKDKTYTKQVVQNFPKTEEERAKLVKKTTSYYHISVIKSFWVKLLKVIMDYLTLDGCFSRIYGHHFVIMNHFSLWG